MTAAVQLRIRNISKTYPNGVRALDDVSLTIPTGMFAAEARPGRHRPVPPTDRLGDGR